MIRAQGSQADTETATSGCPLEAGIQRRQAQETHAGEGPVEGEEPASCPEHPRCFPGDISGDGRVQGREGRYPCRCGATARHIPGMFGMRGRGEEGSDRQDASLQRLRTGTGSACERRDQHSREGRDSHAAGNPWSMRARIRMDDPGSGNRGWHERHACGCLAMCTSPKVDPMFLAPGHRFAVSSRTGRKNESPCS